MPWDPPLAKVAADLRAIPREVRKEVGPAIRKAAGPILQAAKANASWSTRIPGALRIAVRFGRRTSGVALVASAKRAPHARAYEGLGKQGNFRHPVHGHEGRWVTQRRRPFARPAVQQQRDEVRKAINDVVLDAARRHGFS